MCVYGGTPFCGLVGLWVGEWRGEKIDIQYVNLLVLSAIIEPSHQQCAFISVRVKTLWFIINENWHLNPLLTWSPLLDLIRRINPIQGIYGNLSSLSFMCVMSLWKWSQLNFIGGGQASTVDPWLTDEIWLTVTPLILLLTPLTDCFSSPLDGYCNNNGSTQWQPEQQQNTYGWQIPNSIQPWLNTYWAFLGC